MHYNNIICIIIVHTIIFASSPCLHALHKIYNYVVVVLLHHELMNILLGSYLAASLKISTVTKIDPELLVTWLVRTERTSSGEGSIPPGMCCLCISQPLFNMKSFWYRSLATRMFLKSAVKMKKKEIQTSAHNRCTNEW